MKSMKFAIVGNCPTDLASWNEIEVSAHCAIVDETILIRVTLSPPTGSFMERLRQEFAKIESHFSGKLLGIMQCLLADSEGQASRTKLMKEVWGEAVQMFGTIRQVVFRLNTALTKQNFGYTIKGSRKGIYRLVPVEK